MFRFYQQLSKSIFHKFSKVFSIYCAIFCRILTPAFYSYFVYSFSDPHVDDEAKNVCSLYTESELARLGNILSMSQCYQSRRSGLSYHLLDAPPGPLPLKYFLSSLPTKREVSFTDSESSRRVCPKMLCEQLCSTQVAVMKFLDSPLHFSFGQYLPANLVNTLAL